MILAASLELSKVPEKKKSRAQDSGYTVKRNTPMKTTKPYMGRRFTVCNLS
jgi:hypothetical protein